MDTDNPILDFYKALRDFNRGVRIAYTELDNIALTAELTSEEGNKEEGIKWPPDEINLPLWINDAYGRMANLASVVSAQIVPPPSMTADQWVVQVLHTAKKASSLIDTVTRINLSENLQEYTLDVLSGMLPEIHAVARQVREFHDYLQVMDCVTTLAPTEPLDESPKRKRGRAGRKKDPETAKRNEQWRKEYESRKWPSKQAFFRHLKEQGDIEATYDLVLKALNPASKSRKRRN